MVINRVANIDIARSEATFLVMENITATADMTTAATNADMVTTGTVMVINTITARTIILTTMITIVFMR